VFRARHRALVLSFSFSLSVGLTPLDERYVGMAVYVECFVPATELSFSRSPSLSQWVSPLWTRGTWAWRCTWSVSCPPQSSLSLVLLLSLSGSHPFGREVRGHGGVRGVFRARHRALFLSFSFSLSVGLTPLDERYVGMAVYVECFVPATERLPKRSHVSSHSGITPRPMPCGEKKERRKTPHASGV
jgi:hypothetical protein